MPGWGHQLAPSRVLTEMRQLGIAATEFGPEGFLPEPAILAGYGLAPVGGFVPVVLHDPAVDVLAVLEPVLRQFTASGATVLVLAAWGGGTGYDERIELDDRAWRTLLDNLDRITEAAGERGLLATLHPHVGTVVEGRSEVLRVIEGSAVALCLDTGHLLIGGADPAWLAAQVPRRVGHTHLKDVNAALAAKVRSGQLSYTDAVATGLYRPLGHGDVDVEGIVRCLEAAGYAGWFVMEQDVVLRAEPAEGTGPIEDVRTSLAFLDGLR